MKNFFIVVCFFFISCTGGIEIQNNFSEYQISLNPPTTNQKIVYHQEDEIKLDYFLFGTIKPNFVPTDYFAMQIKKYNGNGIANLKIQVETPLNTIIYNSVFPFLVSLLNAGSTNPGAIVLVAVSPYLYQTEKIQLQFDIVKTKTNE